MYKNNNIRNNFELFFARLLILFLLLLSIISIEVRGLKFLIPLIDVITIFYWSIFRPRVINNTFLIITGLLYDVLTNSPLGLNAFLYTGSSLLLSGQRKFFVKSPFSMLWLGFLIFCTLFCIVKWLVIVFYNGKFYFSAPIIVQLFTSIAFYPFLHSLYNKIMFNNLISNDNT
jgi:rod shape-determining protein MreD